jgi:phospholipid transport system substrate-binding protein
MKQKARNLFSLFFISLLLIQPALVQADGEMAKQSLQDFMTTLRTMEFSTDHDTLDPALTVKANQHLDLESMVSSALSESWDDASDEQKKQFMAVMWKLIEKVAYPKSKTFLGSLEIQYDEPKPLEKGYEIITVIKKEEEALDIEAIYLLHEIDNSWKVYDVILDSVSMIEDLSYQFTTIIEESSFDGLLKRMNEKLAEVSEA